MRIWISRRGALGGLACAAIATALALLLTVTAPAEPQRLSVTATDAVVGQAIHATAELSESPEASGKISFEVFGPGDEECTGPALAPAPESASVAGEGAYESGEITPPAAGAYYWSAHYPGDSGNPPADSICLAISSVGKASPSLVGVATSVAKAGLAITDNVTLSEGFAAGGQLVFRAYGPGDLSCTGPVRYEGTAPVNDDDTYSRLVLPLAPGCIGGRLGTRATRITKPLSWLAGRPNRLRPSARPRRASSGWRPRWPKRAWRSPTT